jgi:hypothetical protein
MVIRLAVAINEGTFGAAARALEECIKGPHGAISLAGGGRRIVVEEIDGQSLGSHAAWSAKARLAELGIPLAG